MQATFNLHDTLLRKQDMLVASLEGLRGAIKHGGGKGDVSENEWRKVIKNFLPRRYTVSGKTEVIDRNGHVSEQQDLVIYDRHFCPLFFEEGDVTKVPVESVFAVFEVRPVLKKTVVDYAKGKAATVRALDRTSGEIVDRGQRKPPREPFEIVAGVLTLESGWNPPFGQTFEASLADEDPGRRLHLGCALKHGAFEVVYEEDDTWHVDAASEGSLVFFLMRLFARLQLIGSPMAIDLREYSRPLEVAADEITADGGDAS